MNELRRDLRKIGKRAKAGETITVTAYGEPEFKIVPLEAKP